MSTLQFSNQMWHLCSWHQSIYKVSGVRCIYSNEALTESGGTQKFKVHHCKTLSHVIVVSPIHGPNFQENIRFEVKSINFLEKITKKITVFTCYRPPTYT